MNNQRKDGTDKIVCQLTVRGGKVVYDLNGISSDLWNGQPTSEYKLARYWTTMTTRDEKKSNENKKYKAANAATSH
jgi:dihydroorotase